MFKLDLEKAEEPEIKLPTSVGSSRKQESSRKPSTSALLTMPIEGRKRRWWQRTRWLDGITTTMDMSLKTPGVGGGQGGLVCCSPWSHRVRQDWVTELTDWLTDYAKVFDCVDHKKLWKILKEMGIPDHLTFLLRNLIQVKKHQLELDMVQQTRSK